MNTTYAILYTYTAYSPWNQSHSVHLHTHLETVGTHWMPARASHKCTRSNLLFQPKFLGPSPRVWQTIFAQTSLFRMFANSQWNKQTINNLYAKTDKAMQCVETYCNTVHVPHIAEAESHDVQCTFVCICTMYSTIWILWRPQLFFSHSSACQKRSTEIPENSSKLVKAWD